MRRTFLASLALLALPMAPLTASAGEPGADPFCIIVIEPLDGFRLVRVSVDEELDDATREQYWKQADRDGDGRVTPGEAEAFRAEQLEFFPGEAGLAEKAVLLTLSPAAPNTVRAIYGSTWRQVGHGYYAHQRDLSTFTAATFETQSVREFSFHVGDGIDHVILTGGRPWNDTELLAFPTEPGPSPAPPPVGPSYPTSAPTPPTTGTYPPGCDEDGCAVVEFVVVKAPPGWLVARVQGSAYGRDILVEPRAPEVDLATFDTKSPFSISYVRADAEGGGVDLPIPPLQGSILALAMLGAALLAVRRAR